MPGKSHSGQKDTRRPDEKQQGNFGQDEAQQQQQQEKEAELRQMGDLARRTNKQQSD